VFVCVFVGESFGGGPTRFPQSQTETVDGRKKKKKGQRRKKSWKQKKRKRQERSSSWNVVWSAPVGLPKVGRIKQIMRSSLNDVLLSCAAGAIRMYLQQQGIPFPDDVKVMVH